MASASDRRPEPRDAPQPTGGTPEVRRVIIADPSLRDYVGHHYAYDKSLLDALATQGIGCAALAHKDARRLLPDDARIVPVYTEDMWRKVRAGADWRIEMRVLLLKGASLLVAPLFAAQAICAAVPRRMARARRERSASPAPDNGNGNSPSRPAWRAKEALRARAMRHRLTAKAWVALRELFHLVMGVKGVLGYLVDNARLPRWLLRLALPNPRFYLETLRALRRQTAGKGDLIFAHMLIDCHLLEWALIALRETKREGAQIVLLLRYPAEFYRPRSLRTRLAFRALEQAWRAGVLRLATDSERLARELAAHTFVPIEVFPIPHVATAALGSDRPAGRPLRVASLGNARAEKGILEIARAIETLHASGDAGGFEFILQVNDPDRACRDELARFRARGLAGIRFIDTTLDEREYRELLACADVVLVPYRHEVYAARSSGVFVEALAAGKIVVATSDTWMTDELARFGGGVVVASGSPEDLATALRAARRDRERLAREAREAARRARSFHSPERFVAALRDRLGNFPCERHAAVIYPWNNFLTRAAGASLRTGLMMDLIEARGYALTVLLGSDNEAVEVPARYRVIRFTAEPLRNNLLLHLFALALRIASFGRSRPAEGVLYLYTCWYRRRRYRLALNRALRGCRVAFLEYTPLFELVAPFARAQRIPLVVSEHDVLAEQVSFEPIKRRILAMEVAALRRADLAVSVSERDRATFAALGAQTVLVPNAVAARGRKLYEAGEARAALQRLGIDPPEPYVLFVGSNHRPNLRAAEFLRGLGARLGAGASRLTVVIVGSCHPPLTAMPGFLALGKVTDDARDALYGAAAAVVIPLQAGTGSSLKTIEAMAAGKAVLGTSIAFRGLDVTDGRDAMIEDDLDCYAYRLPELLREPERLARIGRRGREFALRFDYRESYRPYVDYLDGLDAAASSSAAAGAVRGGRDHSA